MNDMGQFVGLTASQTVGGFVYDSSSKAFTVLTDPGAESAVPLAINNAGTIAGMETRHSINYGFELMGSRYQRITPPGATNSIVTGVSSSNKLVGVISHGTALSNFLFSNGNYVRVTPPNAPAAYAHGINPAGTAVVGNYVLSGQITAGFLFQNKALQTLQFPGSSYTTATGMNSAGQVVGYFYDTANIEHGFTWTPPAGK